MRFDHVRVFVQQRLRESTRCLDQPLVGFQVGETQQCLPRLTGAEEFAGAADLEVAPGDFKTVGGLAHGGQALLGHHPERTLVQQQADAGSRAAADPPA